MPKITKLRLHLLQLCRKNSGLFFSGHGVDKVLACTIHVASTNNTAIQRTEAKMECPECVEHLEYES